MKAFNLKNFIKQAQESTPRTPIINGTKIDIFHRTDTQDVVGNVCESGFIAGSGAMYGAGIYANYSLDSCMKKYGLGAYGGIIIRGSVDLNGFIIFDYSIAEQIYGANYRLPHQIEKIIGWDKILSSPSPQNIEDAKKTLWYYHKTLRNRPRRTHPRRSPACPSSP